MLGASPVVAFVATQDPDRARHFYSEIVGLTIVSDDPFALVYAVGAGHLRIQKVGAFTPQPFTALGWQVADIEAIVAALGARSVAFERYPGMDQDALGIWTTPSGARVAWFKDPDGNLLSLTAT